MDLRDLWQLYGDLEVFAYRACALGSREERRKTAVCHLIGDIRCTLILLFPSECYHDQGSVGPPSAPPHLERKPFGAFVEGLSAFWTVRYINQIGV